MRVSLATSAQLALRMLTARWLCPHRFFKMMENDPLRAWYGEGHVLRAADRGAISKLLISDEIFRCVSLFA